MKRIFLILIFLATAFLSYGRTFVETQPGTSVTAIDNYTFLIQEGECYYTENVFTVAAETTVYLVFDTTGMDGRLVSFPTAWACSAGPVLITLGTCASYSSGTALTEINRNYAYNSNEVDVVYGATITSGVFPSFPTILIGGDASPLNSAGGSNFGRLPIILETDIIYVFRIVNENTSEIYLYSDIIWFEVSGVY